MASPSRQSSCEKLSPETESPSGTSSLRDGGSQYSLSSLSGQDEFFKFNKHAETSLHKMEAYLEKQLLTDVTLIAGTRRIPAHRLVLSSVSEYFAAMFTSNLREATQNEIELQDVDGDALWMLVHYCYTGNVELKEDNVESLLGTARLLQLNEVVNACCSFLKRQLHPSNCIGIRQFADTQGCLGLLKIAHDYTSDHFMEVISNQEFLMLPADEVYELLSSDDLNVPSEENIFEALLLWLKHDLPARQKEVSRLLSVVRLPLLSPAFLADSIKSCSFFQEESACLDLFMEALYYHLLPERRSTLQSPRTHPRKSTVGSLYVVGGMDANKGATTIERYDLRLNTWTRVTCMISCRLQFGVSVIDDRLYIVGGRDGLKTSNVVECYDIKTNTWLALPSMITHRHGLGVAVLEGPLYAVGGHDGWRYLNTVERWDPQARQWSMVAPMSTQRSTVGVAVLNNKLYAVGGRDGSCCLRTVECYDPHTNKWMPCASMAKKRGGVGVGVVNGYLYAMGGHDSPTSNPQAPRFDSVERYDPVTDTWTTIATMSIGRDAIGVCLLGDKLFAVGGHDGQRYLNLVEAFDSQTNEWETMAPLTMGRAGASIVVVKN